MTPVAGDLGFFSTPAEQQTRLEEVKAAGRALARDVAVYVPSDPAAWSVWRTNFELWLHDLLAYSPDWLDRAWASTGAKIESLASQLVDLRRDFAAMPGAQVTGPELAAMRTNEPAAAESGPSVLVKAAAVGVGIGIAVLVWRLLSGRSV